jgi:hypothetical protein
LPPLIVVVDDVHRVRRGIDDRRACDSDDRGQVAAGYGAVGNRRSAARQQAGLPERRPGAGRVGVERVDGIILGGCEDDDNGVERFITTTRRQNFLVPPRRNRAFPLIELI